MIALVVWPQIDLARRQPRLGRVGAGLAPGGTAQGSPPEAEGTFVRFSSTQVVNIRVLTLFQLQ